MSRTVLTIDQALNLDAAEAGFWFKDVWYPVIRGGADDSASDDGGSTEGDNSDDSSGDSDDSSKDKGDDEKKFTQEEVNALLARETSKATRGKLSPKELGFETKAELDEFLAKTKQEKEAAKTEAEKAIEEAKKAAADDARANVLSKANERLVKAEFKLKAAEKNVQYPEDAFELVQKLPEWEAVGVDEETGDVDGVDDALMEALEKAKPFLFRSDDDSGGGNDIGAGSRSTGKGKDREGQLREQYPGLRVGH